jgi:PIN domain nuclease of toxin-antitoxin system
VARKERRFAAARHDRYLEHFGDHALGTLQATQLGRIDCDLDAPEVTRALAHVHTWPLTLDVCRAIADLDFRGDPADEIIAATSVVHRVPLVTRDRQIRRSKVVPLAGK